jgi:hypothetical protein
LRSIPLGGVPGHSLPGSIRPKDGEASGAHCNFPSNQAIGCGANALPKASPQLKTPKETQPHLYPARLVSRRGLRMLAVSSDRSRCGRFGDEPANEYCRYCP